MKLLNLYNSVLLEAVNNKSVQQAINDFKKEGLITAKDKPVNGIINIERFNGSNADILPNIQTLDKKGVDRWIKRIKAGERPFVLVNQPRYANYQNIVIDGHHRLKAYEILGIKDIPVIDLTGGKIINNSINESLKSKSEKGNRYFEMLKTAKFQHYDSPKGELSTFNKGEEDRKRLLSKLSVEDKKKYKEWLKTDEGKESLKIWKKYSK